MPTPDKKKRRSNGAKSPKGKVLGKDASEDKEHNLLSLRDKLTSSWDCVC